MFFLNKRSLVLLLLLFSPVSPFSVSTPKMIQPNPPTADLSVEEIHALVDANGRQAPPVSTANAVAVVALGIPALVAVLPFSIIYQVGKALVGTVSPSNDFAHLTPIDSGIQVDAVVDPKDRKYDLVLMGATGFTGKLGVRHLALQYGVNQKVKWAIAGRSQSKLDKVKKEIALELENDDVLQVDTIIVDTTDPSTLPALVKDTRAVSSTAGPFERYGSPVVEACAKYGTHYADITGEAAWVKHMRFRWEETAQKSGAKIVSLCGSDSIPWDLSTLALEDALPEGETLCKAIFVDELNGAASGGTIATLLLNFEEGSRGEPEDAPFDQGLRLTNGEKSGLKFTFTPPGLPSKLQRSGRNFNDHVGFFLLSIVNAEIVKQGVARRNKSTDLVYEEYQNFPDLKTALTNVLILPVALVMMMNPVTKFFLKKILPNPGEGPSMDDMQNKFYGCINGYGEGTNGSMVETVMYFPRDQGYLDTARMVVESGLCMALDQDKLPTPSGGFWTPSTGMGYALMERLRTTGTYFASKKV